MGDVMGGVMGTVWRDAADMRREFAVFFSGAACAMLLALPSIGFSASRSEAPVPAAAQLQNLADSEITMATLHWQARLALADLERARAGAQ